MDDISITIVAYNDQEDVERAVDSIETYTSIEIRKTIYIVDNSDRENTLSENMKVYPDVSYIRTGRNLGFGGGHNVVLSRLNSRLHAIVNPDICLNSDAFCALLDFMQDETIGMAVPKLLDEEGKMQPVYRRELTVMDMFIRMFLKKGFKKRKAYHTMQDADYTTAFEVPFAQGSFLVIRTELYQSLGGFDERFFLYMEDADLCKRVNEKSKLMYCPDAQVIHRWEKGSHKNRGLFKLHLFSMYEYFHKWGWKLI